MDAYEKMLKTIREESEKAVKLPSYGIAEMTGEKTLTYNGMEFDEEDVIVADYLTERSVKTVDFTINQEQPLGEGHHNHTWTNKSVYRPKLKSGDVVFGFLIDYEDDEKFLILCRIGG